MSESTVPAASSATIASFTLNDGATLPAIGLGTFGFVGREGVSTIVSGIDAGYRLLDTASGYRNEAEVGAALRESPVPRASIMVTSKLRGPDHSYDRARRSIRESRERLGGDPIDLYLIHWPNPRVGLFVEAWRALIDARAAGDVLSIGVSNFEQPHLEAIIAATGVVPAVNQIELHPHFPQPELRELNAHLGICTQSWSPLGLGQSSMLADPVLTDIASAHKVSAAQVILRWHHQLDCLPIPRSSNTTRQADNLYFGSFTLTDEDVDRIGAVGRRDAPRYGRLWGGDPATEER